MANFENFNELQDFSDALTAQSSVKWGMGGGVVTSVLGSFTSNDLLVLTGAAVTGLGFLINLFYQYKRNKRAEEQHKLQKQLIEAQIDEIKHHK